MPLKAKITNPSFLKHASAMSTKPDAAPGDDPDDVIFNTFYGARTIELNRPQKLNSLNNSMIRKIAPRLVEWGDSQMANVVIIGGAGQKAFCAGGDVAALVHLNQQGTDGQAASQAYFGSEYQLDYMIATYQKPYVAYMDGITMGGGVGLSVHAPIRIATERTVFAMPETSIGLFPDVGGSFFLPRLDGEIGTYLALTSERLKGVQAFYAGIATHYIDSATLPSLTSRLAELEFKDYDSLQTRLDLISSTIAEFSTGLPPNEPIQLSGRLRTAIDLAFHESRVEGIVSTLEAIAAESRAVRTPNDVDLGEWATTTISTLLSRSPTSLKATLALLRAGANFDIAESFQREFSLAGQFMKHPDFNAGVTARLINKPPTEPIWTPPTIAEVDDADISDMLEPPAKPENELQLPTYTDGELLGEWKDYPFDYGLPSEAAILEVMREGELTQKSLVRHFEQRRTGGIEGVKAKIVDVLARKGGRR